MSAAELIASLLEATLASSAAVMLVLLLRRPLRAAFGASAAYALWGLVPAALFAVLLPSAPVAVTIAPMARIGTLVEVTPSAVAASFDYALWIAELWALGVAVTVLHFAGQQRRFVRGLGRLVQREGGVMQAEAVAGLPAAMGVLRPRIVLPADYDARYSEEQQALMQAHERTHLTRGDLQVNALVLLLRCLFWFNPLLHYAARHFHQDQELSCDQRVIGRFPQARRAYGEAMFKTQLAARALPLGCHWGFSHPLKERIEMLKQPVPSLFRWFAGSTVVAALALAAGFTAWAAQPGRTVADGPNIDVRMQFQLNGKTIATPRVINRSGEPFAIRSGEGAAEIRLDMTATLRPDGSIALVSAVHRGGNRVAQPSLVVPNGREGVIEVGAAAEANPVANDVLRITVVPLVAKKPTPPPAPVASPMQTRAQARVMMPPNYPKELLGQKISGRVVVHLDVGPDGVPADVEVVESKPKGVFDAATLKAVKQWRFEPARENGKPVAARVRVPVYFEANGEHGGIKAGAEPIPAGRS